MQEEGRRTPAGRLTSATTEPVDAATVMLVRDRPGPGGPPLEVLLLERHLDSDFAGGALVFPGGKVDRGDRRLDGARWTGKPLPRWRSPLGVANDRDALGLLVAAVRETFEEAGVLLARYEDGSAVTADDLASPPFVAARRRLSRRDARWDWGGWLADEGLALDLGALALWSWWVTPKGQHKRFDTRFFIARLPAGQVASHDEVETTSRRWLRPLAALDAHRDGTAVVIFPTRRNLAALARYATAQSAWEAADRGDVDQRRIEPKVVVVDGIPMVRHPDDAHPEPL